MRVAAALSIVLALMSALLVQVFMADVDRSTDSAIVERGVGREPAMEGPAGLHLLPGTVTTTRESIRLVQPVQPVQPRLNQMDKSGMPFLMVVPARDGSPTIELRRCCERDIVAPMHHSIDPFRPPEPFR